MSEYDTDILQWSERQAALLRRQAAGKLINQSELDWSNIAEEIEAVGQSQVDAVKSWLYQALLHRLKSEAWPLSREVPHWQAEARGFCAQARRKYRPMMARKLDLPSLYADALYAPPDTLDGQPPQPVAQTCPVTLDELLAVD